MPPRLLVVPPSPPGAPVEHLPCGRGVERSGAIGVLVVVTAVWEVTFVQVKDAVALYPLFAFLALRFATASCTLAPWLRRSAYTVEPIWTAFFGFTLAGDRLGATAWLGGVLIVAGITLAEPVAAGMLVRLVRRPRPRPT